MKDEAEHEARRHPLDIFAIITAITLVFLIKGFLFRLPLMPLLSTTLLELLPSVLPHALPHLLSSGASMT